MIYTGKVYRPDADNLVIDAGGVLDIKTGAVVKANGAQADAITVIGDSATGAEIAVAVNAIIAALKGAGIIKSA